MAEQVMTEQVKKWNKEQQQVIDSRDSNVLVSAAAGSGKTAVLVERILQMVQDEKNPCDIDEFLVVTFTNAAAAQMRQKISDKLGKAVTEDPSNEHLVKQLSLINKADITTIDSFCLKVVKENFNYIGVDSSLQIMDEKIAGLVKDDIIDKLFDELFDVSNGLGNAANSDFTLELAKDFFELSKAFENSRDEEIIKSMVYQICKMASSASNTIQWLEEAKESAHITNKDELSKSLWMQAFIKDKKIQADSMRSLAEKAKEITKRPDGCGKNAEVVDNDLFIINSVLKASDYDSLCNATKNSLFKTSAVKKEGAEKENYQEFKCIRDKYREDLKNLGSNMLSTDVILEEAKNNARWIDTIIEICKIFLARFMLEKEKKKQFEFSDIAHMALKILCEGYDKAGYTIPTAIGKNMSNRYREIFIDEYQDSNFIQEDILNCVSKHFMGVNNIFMVGDVKQSIYRFRMARPELFIDKFNNYVESETDDNPCRLINLKTNYRSRKVVLDAVNYIFKKIMHKDLGKIEYDENAELNYGGLYAETDKNISDSAELMLAVKDSDEEGATTDAFDETEELATLEYEAIMVAERIKELVDKDKGLDIWDDDKKIYRRASYKDCAVLLRSMKKKGDIFAKAFTDEGIPVVIDNPSGYFDAIEVVTLLSMLRVIDNVRQDVPFSAVLLSPIGNITNDDLAIISSVRMLKKQKYTCFYDKCCQFILLYGEATDIEDKYAIAKKLDKVIGLIDEMKELKPFISIAELIETVVSETKYDIYVSALPQGEKRIANINMLIEKAEDYSKGSYKGLFNFLRYMEKLKIHDEDFGEASIISGNEDVVRITTMHKSKGLEYPIVFVSGLGNKFNDNYKKGKLLLHSDYYMASRYINLDKRIERKSFIQNVFNRLAQLDNIAEEQRVLYVAMTRAREKLILTGSVRKIPDAIDINYNIRANATSYLDWIFPCINLDVSETYFKKTAITRSEISSSIIKKVSEKQIENTDIFTTLDTAVKDSKVEEVANKQKKIYDYLYSHDEATRRKVKMSISEIKKMKMYNQGEPEEAVDSFVAKVEKGSTGAKRGTIIHKLMELLPFKTIDSIEKMTLTIDELLLMNIFTEEERNINKISDVYEFYNSELFMRMRKADEAGHLFKEKQFTMGFTAKEIFDDTKDLDTIIVQGIVDAYFYEGDDIVLMDYKTDSVKTGQELIGRYKAQLDYYGYTLERLTGKKVKEKLIYSFCLGQTIEC